MHDFLPAFIISHKDIILQLKEFLCVICKCLHVIKLKNYELLHEQIFELLRTDLSLNDLDTAVFSELMNIYSEIYIEMVTQGYGDMLML